MSGTTRREALAGLLASASLALGSVGCATRRIDPDRTLLPPTAGLPEDFFARCIRCHRCGEVCTAGCIEFHPLWTDPRVAGTPYIEPRKVACNTCMACTQVCPTGALTPVARDDEPAVVEAVDMGTAYVDEGLCLSFLGRVCGECHDACPFPGIAIKLGTAAQPEVLADCVGCGRCEERCPQIPAAIRAFPVGRDTDLSPRWTGPSKDRA